MSRKVALIIGNDDYSINPLRNCVNDATCLANVLRCVENCQIELKTNLKADDMYKCINAFIASIKRDDFAIFFFAGHGIQWGDQNFLLPCDNSEIKTGKDMQRYAINAQMTVDEMAEMNPDIVLFLLDCCRAYWTPAKTTNNRAMNSQIGGLSQMKLPKQTLIAFACAAGEIVSDQFESSSNGLFTKYLVEHITIPNEHIETVLRRVANSVAMATNHSQRPFRVSSIISDEVYLTTRGVGRSTFINALANYLVDDTLQQAINDRMQVLFPFSFSHIDDETFEEKWIVYGEEDEYEHMTTPGATCTQKCRSFVFTIGDRLLRLIDTPPVKDTRGFEQDMQNVDEIMNYIARYEYLNGICILLKPNEERLNISFRYVVAEMLRHLPKNAMENIMFVFTNARSAFFTPGDTKRTLENLFDRYQQEHGVQLLFQKENRFLVDNEAFRYLALYHHGIRLDNYQTYGYIKSWNHTVKECVRLLDYITDRPAHAIHDTVSLYQVQQLISILTHSIFQISEYIEQAIQRRGEDKKSISRNSQSLPQNNVQILSLDSPQLVCTNPKCLGIAYVDSLPKIEYKSICYHGSYFTNNAIGNKNDLNIRACAVMDQETGICTKCYCSWKEHMVVEYEYRRTCADLDSRKKQSEKTNEISYLSQIDKRITDLKDEQRKIENVYKKLCKFLQINAILPFNDDLLEYAGFFLREEQMKNSLGAENKDVIKDLEILLSKYRKEINLLKTTLENERCSADQTELIDVKDIFSLVGSLCDLPITGQEILKQVEELRLNQSKIEKREIFVQLPAKAHSSQLMFEFKRCMSKS